MSPPVKKAGRRSACFLRKAATSFASQSATSLASASRDLGSSIFFMGMLLRKRRGQQLVRQRIRIGLAPRHLRGERGALTCEQAAEAFQHDVFGGLAQPEVCDRKPAPCACVGAERDFAMAREGG